MRAARFFPDGVALADVEPGALRPGWVRIAVSACGICGSDLHAWSHAAGESGRIPGHEIAGTVLLESSDASDSHEAQPIDPVPDLGVYPGDHARRARATEAVSGRLCVVDPRVFCGRCDFCRAGDTHLCRRGQLIGVTLPGGFAEWVDVPRSSVHPVAEGLDPVEAAFAEPLAVALRALARAKVGLESRVLVLGAGTLGLLVGVLARQMANQVAVVARYPRQRSAAEGIGLVSLSEPELATWAARHEPDIVVETVGGTAETLALATRFCRSGGCIVVLGLFDSLAHVDVRDLVLRELRLIGSNTYAQSPRGSEFAAAVEWLPRLRPALAALATHQFPLEDIDAALRCAADKSAGSIKVCLRPDEGAGEGWSR